MNHDERELWRVGRFSCVMVSCCSGAELQVREAQPVAAAPGARAAADERVVLRELYPTKSDLYERARSLEGEYHRQPLL